AGFSYDNICGDFEFQNESTVADGELTYFWDFDDGNTSTDENPIHSYASGGDYEVFLTVTHESGCTDTYMDMVSFYNPIAQFDHDVACVETETCFYDESIPNSDSISTWIWNFGNGNSSSSQNPCIVYTSPGQYIVTLVVVNSDGCFSEPAIDTLNVDYPPEAEFIANPACFHDSSFFINITDTHDIEIAFWQWDFGDPASGANNTSALFEPKHLFTAEGPFDVTLEVENINGCISSIVETILVDSLPDADFSMPDIVAVGVEFTITDLSIAYGSPILTQFWDFGDGQTAINPNPVIHTYTSPGTYEICLYITNFSGCSDSICYTITISALPFADFTYESDITLITNFFDNSNPDTTIVDWFWDFGDLTVTSDTISGTPTPTYTYPEEGYYNVFLEVLDSYGGISDTIKTIYVGNALVADYYHQDVCLGDTVIFYDNSYSPLSADIDSWYWNFDDGTDTTYFVQSDSIVHYYDTAGVYYVSFAISGFLGSVQVSDTMKYEVTVFQQPIARIDTNGLIICLTNAVDFNDSSIVLDNDSITAWFWEFGDGYFDTIQNPSHVYDSIKEYQVILTVNTSHYCSSTDTVIARVTDSPDIDFVVDHACANAATNFIPDETNIEITDWLWTFGDQYNPGPDTSTQSHPTWWYSRVGTYTATMNASSFGCVTKREKTFLVYPIPYASFNVTPDFKNVQGRTKFDNTSIYATHYLWDFGNGNTSTVVNPIEVYEKDSTYIITLASYNEYNCTDTATFVLHVFFKGLYFPTAFTPNNPNDEVSKFQPKGVNLAKYLVQVFDMRGNLLWESDKLDESGSPVEGWDGYSNGLLMPQGMYIWKAEGVFRDGSNWKGSELQSGDPQPYGTITLIR
ncbi:MAG: PKD domain-containing protein, partial [Bacteroidales bacterium]|nr:PKD domain-containing protein [Bacteroidales bacterium]